MVDLTKNLLLVQHATPAPIPCCRLVGAGNFLSAKWWGFCSICLSVKEGEAIYGREAGACDTEEVNSQAW